MINTTGRTATWTQIGTNVDMCTSIEEVLATAGLDYEVEKQKIYLGNNIEIPDKFATVNTSNNAPIGIVGNNYTICQNIDAFNFVNNINDKVTFVKAGETKSGMIYVIARLDDVEVLEDKITPYVIFQNGHNGIYSLKTTICPLRIVCQNQFGMSFKESPNTITIQHSNSMIGKMKEAEELMKNTATYMQTFNSTAEELATMHINNTNPKDIINKFFMKAVKNKEVSDRQLDTIANKTELLYNMYNNNDNGNFRGTVWGMINAFSDFTTHIQPQRLTNTSAENKFVTVTMDPRIMREYLNYVMSFVG